MLGLLGSMAQVTKKTRLSINASIFLNINGKDKEKDKENNNPAAS